MRALIQRVSDAHVTIKGDRVAQIGPGMLVLVCAMPDDTPLVAQKLAIKISKLRIFADDTGRMNLSLTDSGGAALVVSQFTLAADTSRGNRPGFSGAADPEKGEALYQDFVAAMLALDTEVQTGQFGADMAVALTNDGPVTIWIDTDA